MRCLTWISLMILYTGLAQAQQTQSNQTLDLLRDSCRYEPGKELISLITETRKIANDKNTSISIELNISAHPQTRKIHTRLTFACYLPSYNGNAGADNENPVINSAKEGIISEDTGGRYGRNISWEKPFSGQNWKGTVAYVDSIFGDGQRMDTPDFFLICPGIRNSACFSIEIEQGSPSGPARGISSWDYWKQPLYLYDLYSRLSMLPTSNKCTNPLAMLLAGQSYKNTMMI